MRELVIDTAELNSHTYDLSKYAKWSPEHAGYMELPPGKEHYRLLSYLSHKLQPGETVLDVGTYLGNSALALSDNPHIHVVSYDIESKIPDNIVTPKHRENIEFRIGNVLNDMRGLLNVPIIFLDTNHDGTFERQFIGELTRLRYKGIVLCDDIHLNQEMRAFWRDVALPKMDLTPIGHFSGTGLIIFDPRELSVSVRT